MRIFTQNLVQLAMEQRQRDWTGYRAVTLNDVAREAGVSQSAASVILNGARSGTRVSQQKRRVVLEVAEKIGYRPNALARSLTTGRTNRIGIYSSGELDSKNQFFAELLSGVLREAGEMRLNTMVHSSGWDDASLLDLVSNRALDGLIIHSREQDPIIPLLSNLRVPAVAVADRISGLPSVVVDDRAGGEMQARHLASLGHKRVLVKACPHLCDSGEQRVRSFIESAESQGMICTKTNFNDDIHQGLTPEEIMLLTRDSERYTAVVAWNDYSAHTICEKLASLGIAIPEKVAVVGFDGFDQMFTPVFRLTAIKAHWPNVGSKAVKHLHKLLEGHEVPDLTVMPVEFVRGGTT